MVNDLDGMRDAVTLTFRRAGGVTGIVTAKIWQPRVTAGLLENLPGANSSDVPLWARLISPQSLPEGVRHGDEAPLTLNGEQGVVILQPHTDPRAGPLRDLFGQRILLAWRGRGSG